MKDNNKKYNLIFAIKTAIWHIQNNNNNNNLQTKEFVLYWNIDNSNIKECIPQKIATEISNINYAKLNVHLYTDNQKFIERENQLLKQNIEHTIFLYVILEDKIKCAFDSENIKFVKCLNIYVGVTQTKEMKKFLKKNKCKHIELNLF